MNLPKSDSDAPTSQVSGRDAAVARPAGAIRCVNWNRLFHQLDSLFAILNVGVVQLEMQQIDRIQRVLLVQEDRPIQCSSCTRMIHQVSECKLAT